MSHRPHILTRGCTEYFSVNVSKTFNFITNESIKKKLLYITYKSISDKIYYIFINGGFSNKTFAISNLLLNGFINRNFL